MRAMKSRILLSMVSFLMLFGYIGCVGTKSKVYINPNVNFRFVKKVGVLPFENFTNDRFAHKKVRDIFVTTLLASEMVEVPELGELLQVINNINLASSAPGQETSTGTITREVAKELGQTLKIQGIILGNVEEYSIIRSGSGSYPEVSLSLRMIDAKTGSIIWAISHTEKGNRIIPSILGIGEGTVTETAIKACKKIVETLIYK